jgi:hypothetical protein
MSYNVYTVEYVGSPNHVALFIEMQGDGSGQIFHVVGNILQGMTYETKPGKNPQESLSFVPGSKKHVGHITQSDMGKLDELCRSVPPPGAQLKLNGTRKDPTKPLRRCGEWVQEVRAAALSRGLISL